MLKALMLRKKIDDKQKELDAVRAKKAGFTQRESEIATMIDEAGTDEERSAVESEIAAFEAEQAETEQIESNLQDEIRQMQAELDELEKQQQNAETPAPAAQPADEEERKENKTMITRKFYGMSNEERDQFFAREDVKKLLGEVRAAIKEHRAITNVGLTIPEVMLPMIEQEVEENSKLLPYVHFEVLRGTGRALISGSYPEAVWTEMCATLNELSLGFNDVELDGFKVGGYFAICNAVVEDNDVDLAARVIKALGVGVSKAVDKAIVYGTGVKMPLGIVTRLAQTAEPADYPETARTWVDLHSTHVITGTGATGVSLFQEIASHAKLIINDYFSGEKIWLMNAATHLDLKIQAMGTNMNAAIVSGIEDTMPVIGGKIIELPFIPDGNVVAGYGEAYLMAQRAGFKLGMSEHAKFIEDKTVFKGTARYDGKPSIAEAWEVFSLTTTAPTTSGIPFPEDTANP